MLVPKPSDARHKYHLLNLLHIIIEDRILSNALYFKGGSCAALRGLLDRFSVDLDFDILDKSLIPTLRPHIQNLVTKSGYRLSDESQHHLQFFLKYQAPDKERNTLKLEASDLISPHNQYEVVRLQEINLLCHVQTTPTITANKMVAALGRISHNGHASGRDFYDLHAFLLAGLPINYNIVEERTGEGKQHYLAQLLAFVKRDLTDDLLYADLNSLVAPKDLRRIVKEIRFGLPPLLQDELKRQGGVI